MNPIDLDFYNDERLRIFGNCYLYAVGSHYGIVDNTDGVTPGEIRAKRSYKEVMAWYDLKARLIVDGLIPLPNPHKNNLSVPTPPEGHYVCAVFIDYRKRDGGYDFSCIKIDEAAGDTIKHSKRNSYGRLDANGQVDAKHAVLSAYTETLEEFYIRPELRFLGFFACPNGGINQSMQKVVYDIHGCGGNFLNGIDTRYIDANLEFYENFRGLQSGGFESKEQADSVLAQYGKAAKKYIGFVWKENPVLFREVYKIPGIYQKTPLAAADQQRVYEHFIKDFGLPTRLFLKACKVY
ncbi:MAG: hypothetical protein FWF97_00345 [Alphaproteobacteria bacterium]|nr:hypothetical protein [Alphaproteobacteria bacterium]